MNEFGINKEQYMRFFHAGDHCSVRMGVRLLDMGRGYARAGLRLTDDSRNIMGNLHGGALATLADITAGCCVIYHGRVCVTLDTNIRYLKGVRSGNVTASAKELRAGGRICVCSVDITDDAGDLCCAATISMYLTNEPVTGMVGGES